MTTQDAQDFLMAAMMAAGLVLGVVMLLLASERLNRWLDDRSKREPSWTNQLDEVD
jgi:hypothetical protein